MKCTDFTLHTQRVRRVSMFLCLNGFLYRFDVLYLSISNSCFFEDVRRCCYKCSDLLDTKSFEISGPRL